MHDGHAVNGDTQSCFACIAVGAAKARQDDLDDRVIRLDYAAEASVGGKLALLGSRLIDGLARETADQFFAAFRGMIEYRSADLDKRKKAWFGRTLSG